MKATVSHLSVSARRHPIFRGSTGAVGWRIFEQLAANAQPKSKVIKRHGELVRLKQGQCYSTCRGLQKETGIAKSTIHRWWKKFVHQRFIHVETRAGNQRNYGTGYSVVTILKYLSFSSGYKKAGQGVSHGRDVIDLSLTPSDKVIQETGEQLEFDTSPAKEPTNTERLVKVFNAHRPPEIPEATVEDLPSEAVDHAFKAWEAKPDEGYWVKVVTRLARSLWLTGQVSRNGIGFNTATLFDFIVVPGKAAAILKGKYDAKSWGRGKPRPDIAVQTGPGYLSSHNSSNAQRGMHEVASRGAEPATYWQRIYAQDAASARYHAEQTAKAIPATPDQFKALKAKLDHVLTQASLRAAQTGKSRQKGYMEVAG